MNPLLPTSRRFIPLLCALIACGPRPPGQAQDSVAKTERSAGVTKRVPWTLSRITGSPEPPPPYRIERAFPKLRFSEPVELVSAPGNDRLFLLELKGKIFSFPADPNAGQPDLFVDVKRLHPDLTMAYGIAFHPRFQENRHVYLCYVLKDGDPDATRVSRFTALDTSTPRIDPQSEQVVITWLGGGHNGGSLQFGPDGCLYISTGDGKGPDPPDTLNTGQDIGDLLSSILRIDVDRAEEGKPYRVPADNPFVKMQGARPEVWCYGLRNPWRMSFDSATGDLWVGDVGWELWELVYRVQKGANYGWSLVEGRQIVNPDGRPGPTPIVPPTAVHPHSEAASITGGYVYHGKRLTDLQGAYVYGDYETGKIWALRHKNGEVTSLQEIVDTPVKIACFGVDHAGELYIVDHAGGGIHQLAPNSATHSPLTFPRKLGETGLFTDAAKHRVAPGVIPFSVNSELWNDDATGERFVALPGDSMITTTNSPWRYPKDAVLAKTISLEMERGKPSTRRRVETQVLHFNGDSWNAYTYRWNDPQTDAELVGKSGADQVFRIKDAEAVDDRRQQTWRFQSRAECLRCHNSWCGTTLGFIPAQLNRDHEYSSSGAAESPTEKFSQLRALAHMGIVDCDLSAGNPPPLANPRDPSPGLADRARSYLHVNCSHCHREHAGGSVLVFMNHDLPLEKTALIGTKPAQGSFGITGARVVAPGDPYRSVLYYRMCKLGRGHMPYLGSSMVDVKGIMLLHDWIKQLAAQPTAGSDEPREIAMQREESAALMRQLCGRESDSGGERGRSIDKLLNSVSGALTLLRAIDESALEPPLKQAALDRALTHPDPLVRDLFERFVPEEQRIKTLGTVVIAESILSLKGDAGRGRKLFFQEGGAQCFTCHRVNGEGRDFGPDLSQIGRKYTRGQLLESILEPSKTIDPNYAAFVVETKHDTSNAGFVVRRTSSEVVFKIATGAELTIPMADITRMETQRLSLMPEQLLQSLTAQQAADLIQFLQSLR